MAASEINAQDMVLGKVDITFRLISLTFHTESLNCLEDVIGLCTFTGCDRSVQIYRL